MEYPPQKQSNRGRWLTVAAAVAAIFIVFNVFVRDSHSAPDVTKAVAVLKGDSVTGTITFEQTANSVKISGQLRNLDPLALRGLHIHQYGDLTGGCVSAGGHYNPLSKNHGPRGEKTRHVGDLGNIKSDEAGVATFSFEDSLVSLNGPLSVLGRAVVIHAGTDDLGRGGDPESLKTGNAGARAACGVIGLANDV
ncbi:superoxide dismutase [Mycena amicta]|nr:superoxide dismutase [Mycena amicta]